jgi:Zn-dependent metalloprotease
MTRKRTFCRNLDGFIPVYMLREIAARNPLKLHGIATVATTQRLWVGSPARQSNLHRYLGKDGSKLVRQIYDGEGKESLPGKRARFEGEPSYSGEPEVNLAYDFFGDIDRYYRTVHNRNSYDGNGAPWNGVPNYGSQYANAFWNGSQMVSGKGDGEIFRSLCDLNVWAHELGHAVTEYAVDGGIEYYKQAGAINEHLSDVSASNVESWLTKTLPSKYHWLIGKEVMIPLSEADSKGGKYWRHALRDMRFPGTAYNDPAIGKDRQPADMDHYVNTSSDNGGVHTNSGIPNRLYALFCLGVENAGLGNTWETTFGRGARIWYAARPDVGNKPTFAKMAYYLREACAVESGEENKLREILDQALAAVKVKPNKNLDETLDDTTSEG